jgi:hypothetical protein
VHCSIASSHLIQDKFSQVPVLGSICWCDGEQLLCGGHKHIAVI